MRKVVGSLDGEQRHALLWLADFGIAVCSSGLIVMMLKDIVGWLAA
jgi:hypothetical protein